MNIESRSLSALQSAKAPEWSGLEADLWSRSLPPGDFFAALSHNETQFLIGHGLGGSHVTINALYRLEAES